MKCVPPVHILVLAGWVFIVGSGTTVTVAGFDVAVPQPSPVAEIKTLNWVVAISTWWYRTDWLLFRELSAMQSHQSIATNNQDGVPPVGTTLMV